MHVYYAVTGNIAKPGAWHDLCVWSQQRIAQHKAKIIKIVKARPGERYARIIMEITADGARLTPNGRSIYLAALKKAAQHDV